METPLISAIITTYNSEDYIKRSLESILNQTYTNIEVIVVDDGGHDNTVPLVKENYPTVRVIQKENGGVSTARNRGIEEAEGEWVAFLDADDFWMPEKLERQLEFSVNGNFEVTYHNGHHCYNDIEMTTSMIDERKASLFHNLKDGKVNQIFYDNKRMTISFPSSMMIRKDVVNKYGPFDKRLGIIEDYEIFVRYFCQNAAIGICFTPLFYYETGNIHSTSKRWLEHSKEKLLCWFTILDEFIKEHNPNLYKEFVAIRNHTLLNDIVKVLANAGFFSLALSHYQTYADKSTFSLRMKGYRAWSCGVFRYYTKFLTNNTLFKFLYHKCFKSALSKLKDR